MKKLTFSNFYAGFLLNSIFKHVLIVFSDDKFYSCSLYLWQRFCLSSPTHTHTTWDGN